MLDELVSDATYCALEHVPARFRPYASSLYRGIEKLAIYMQGKVPYDDRQREPVNFMKLFEMLRTTYTYSEEIAVSPIAMLVAVPCLAAIGVEGVQWLHHGR
ncbi:MAG: hypothetical protein HGA85_08260 [Nanoarchaeota archaeon]|nr:hypothetical protein [Nanoarchaeota archaeon]